MKPQLLIFDDEPMAAEAIALALNTSDNLLSALTAESDEQAIEILRTQAIDVFLFNRDPFTLDSCKFVRAVKFDPQAQHIPIVIWSRTPQDEAQTMFRQAGIDFEKDIAAYMGPDSTPDRFRSVLNSLLNLPRPPSVGGVSERKTPDPRGENDSSPTGKPSDAKSIPRLVQINLVLSSDDPEWPRFLSQNRQLHGSVLAKYPPSPERMKAGWPTISSPVYVEIGPFVKAVKAYENAFNRKVLTKTGSAVIRLEEISNGSTVSFTAPDPPRSSKD